jgi:hypothetical protein
LVQQGRINELKQSIPWFHLASAPTASVSLRLSALSALHVKTQRHAFVTRLGQTLEIAVYRALLTQSTLPFLGAFLNLNEHDDATLYKKEEPPSSLSGRTIPDGKKLDFLVSHSSAGYAGIEVKNIREWFYPDREEVRELLFKCCALDVVPVLIARRIHYSSFTVLNPCGVIIHQTYNQLYPAVDADLAAQVRDKTLMGYHDVRLGNVPDARLLHFIQTNLPALLPQARTQFDEFKDLLCAYASGAHPYKSFAARVKRRLRGEPEDFPTIDLPDDVGQADFDDW